MKILVAAPLITPSLPAGSPDRITQLDAMRGLAALVVCLGHAVALFPWTDSSPLSDLARKTVHTLLDGAAMVDFFFVLSGFVLALPFVGPNSRGFDSIDFFTRRIARIYPAFWFSLLFALALRLISADALHSWASTDWGRRQWTDPITVRSLVDHFLLVFGVPQIEMLNGPIWSIGVEVQVAIILPLFFFLIGPARSWRTVALMGALSIVLAFMIGAPSPLIFVPLFVAGVAAARFRAEIRGYVRRMSKPMSIGLGLLALVLIYNRAVTGRLGWRFPDLRPELIAGSGAVIWIMLADARQGFAAALNQRPLLLLGKVSYSLYLIHLPLFLWLFPLLYGATGSVAVCIVGGPVLALALAWLLFHTVEQPGLLAGRWLARTMVALAQSSPLPISRAYPVLRERPHNQPRAVLTGSAIGTEER